MTSALKQYRELQKGLDENPALFLYNLMKQFDAQVAGKAKELKAEITNITNGLEERLAVFSRETKNQRQILEQAISKLKNGNNGEKGEDGRDGRDADEQLIINSILAQIPPPQIGPKGENGRNPLTVSATKPLKPQIGDLWYQP